MSTAEVPAHPKAGQQGPLGKEHAVTVKVYGTLGYDLGKMQFQLDFNGSTLGDLIDQMAAQYGAVVKE